MATAGLNQSQLTTFQTAEQSVLWHEFVSSAGSETEESGKSGKITSGTGSSQSSRYDRLYIFRARTNINEKKETREKETFFV